MRLAWAIAAIFLAAQPAARKVASNDRALVKYAKGLSVSTLDPALAPRRLEDWLKSGPPHVDKVEWHVDCDIKFDFPEPKEGYPLCVKATFWRHKSWGVVMTQVGTEPHGIEGRPKVRYVFVGREGRFYEKIKLSQLPAILAESDEEEKAGRK